MDATRATVFVGGFAPHVRALNAVVDGSLVIAADSGWEHAVASGRRPHVLVGDMDSIPAAHLADAIALGTEVIEHPVAKDETDTELALALAVPRGARHITVIAGGGDRPDHVFAMLHSLASPSFAGVTVDGWLSGTRFRVCTSSAPAELHTRNGDTVSLLPVGGAAVVTATGLHWPLSHDTLVAHASRGVSNVATGPSNVTVHSGTLIAFITPGDDT
ncbi:MAG: thiamine diphosphokinase [Acidimicrobiales bacterium]